MQDSAVVIGMLVGAILGGAAGLGVGLALGLSLSERRSRADWRRRPIGRYEGTASAAPIPEPKARLVDERPWERDPEFSDLDVQIDEGRGVAIIIDDYAQESREVPLADFLLRYKPSR